MPNHSSAIYPSLKILIIDDETVNLSLLRVFFADRNEIVTVCESGKEAIDILENSDQEFDIVFLDLMMPDINGFDVLTKIRQLPARKDLPVIIQTGKADHASIAQAMNAGADNYLIKPFSLDNLLDLFHQCIRDKKSNIPRQ